MISVPNICQRHQLELLEAAGIGPDGPWRSAIVVGNIAMFQAATVDGRVWQRCAVVDGDKRDAGDLSLVLAEEWAGTLKVIREQGVTALAKKTQTLQAPPKTAGQPAFTRCGMKQPSRSYKLFKGRHPGIVRKMGDGRSPWCPDCREEYHQTSDPLIGQAYEVCRCGSRMITPEVQRLRWVPPRDGRSPDA